VIDELQTTAQTEDTVGAGTIGAEAAGPATPVANAMGVQETTSVLDGQILHDLEQPLTTHRESASAQRLVVAFSSLQSNLRLLAHGPAIDAALLRLHIELLAQTRSRIEAALAAKRDIEAWGLFNDAWLRFAQIVPDDQLALLLSLRIQSNHGGTGTQTMIAWVESLREEAVMLACDPRVDRARLRGYVCVLEQSRAKIESALAVRQFDLAWALLRSLWELRFDILPAESLEAERQALELLTASAGRGKRQERLDQALKKAQTETDISRLRSVLAWVKREINESSQGRYWRYNIYERRVKWTARIMVAFLLLLTLATVVVLRPESGMWFQQLALLLAVSLAGSLGGAVSGLRTSEEISQHRISSSYFKQAVTYLRMLVGAAAALAVYFLLVSGLLTVTFGTGSQDLVYLALGFLAGFSERFFLESLDRVGASVGVRGEDLAPAPQAAASMSGAVGTAPAGDLDPEVN
jgi:hypothetical protein